MKQLSFLLDKSNDSSSKKVFMLKAPTGAGKTILLVEYVDKYLITHDKTVFYLALSWKR
jgi:type III restriction enzyme